MKRIIPVIAIALCAAGPGPAAADLWELEGGREAAVVGAGAALWGAGLLAPDAGPPAPDEAAVLDPAGLGALDRRAVGRWSPRAAAASDVLVWSLSAAPVGLMAVGPGRNEAGPLAVMYGETMLLSGGAVFALKRLVGRPRPFAYDPDPRIPDEVRRSASARRSFPSGHTAQAFAAAVFFASTFSRLQPDSSARGWVWGGCLGAAATTGWLRFAAGRHFPTDILAGAAIGAAAGWLVPAVHELDEGGGPAGGARLVLGFGF
jgi:membrane-associated phospholipid phosphatase